MAEPRIKVRVDTSELAALRERLVEMDALATRIGLVGLRRAVLAWTVAGWAVAVFVAVEAVIRVWEVVR